MIDLEQEALPDSIMLDDGAWATVLTDFRVWLRFGRCLTDLHVWWPGIFPDGAAPGGGWHDGAIEFWQSPVPCPHGSGRKEGVRTLDMAADSDYIVGSFQQAYGIDLTDPALDMHWHRFQALVRSLPQDTIVSRIVGWRSWTPTRSRKKPDEAARQLRDAWSLERIQDPGAVAEQQELLGSVAEAFEREMDADGK